MRSVKYMIGSLPVVGPAARHAYKTWRHLSGAEPEFQNSKDYWERRYALGGDSGAGSYNHLARFKADVLSTFVAAENITSVIELGCGDGNQLALADYPSYVGFDVSPSALALCRSRFAHDPTKSFELLDNYDGRRSDLVLSLDVIYHLVEDAVFEDHMRMLFGAADRFVIIYSSDTEDNESNAARHVRHRNFTRWISANQKDWTLYRRIANQFPSRGNEVAGSFSDFYIFRRT